MTKAKIGVIGGSGLYQLEGLKVQDEVSLNTPFGSPSDKLVLGELAGHEVVFLARHGRGHTLTPSEINFRANIFAMKLLGVEAILSVSAVGSMREEVHVGDMVIVDQFFDRTRGRASTFFGDGIVAHVAFADPTCPALRALLYEACRSNAIACHKGGTYLCIEGPEFSTKAESRIYRQWGVDVIGMTVLQEARLAREAEICYGAIAMSTDYDCWYEGHDTVTAEMIIKVLNENVVKARTAVAAAIRATSGERTCGCSKALAHAILTARDAIPAATRKKLEIIIGKYI